MCSVGEISLCCRLVFLLTSIDYRVPVYIIGGIGYIGGVSLFIGVFVIPVDTGRYRSMSIPVDTDRCLYRSIPVDVDTDIPVDDTGCHMSITIQDTHFEFHISNSIYFQIKNYY